MTISLWIQCYVMTSLATHGTSLLSLEVLWWISIPDFRFDRHNLSRKEADSMEEVVSEAFTWQNLREGCYHGKTVHRSILVSMVKRGGRRLTPILQSYFSAPRTHFGFRHKDELKAKCQLSSFLMPFFWLSPSKWRPPPPVICESALDYKCLCRCE